MRTQPTLPQARRPGLRLRACATAVGWLLLCAPTWAQNTGTAAQRLESLRLELLERAAKAAVHVDATAWIDTQGRLQESSRFRQSLRFGEVQAAASADLKEAAQRSSQERLPPHTLAQSLSQACVSSAATGLRHVIGFETVIDADLPAAWQAPLRSAIEEGAWQRTGAGPNAQRPAAWRLVPTLPDSAYASRYEQALLETQRPNVAWRLQVLAQWPSAAPSDRAASASGLPQGVQLSMSLVQTDGQRMTYRDTRWVRLETTGTAWSAPTWTPGSQDGLAERLNLWAQAMTQWLACHPVRPQVTAQDNGFVTLSAGQLAGLKTGDEWVLLQPQRLSTQMLEPDTLSHLVHATVVEVLPHSARLRVDAGSNPGKPAPGEWQAWSWNDLQAAVAAMGSPTGSAQARTQAKAEPSAAIHNRLPMAGLFGKLGL